MDSIKIPHCCNCAISFTITGYSNKKRFPHTLHCGHPVCERCLMGNLKASSGVICHRCSFSSKLSESDIKKIYTFPESLNTHFPINFYVYGQLAYNIAKESQKQQPGSGNYSYFPAGTTVYFNKQRQMCTSQNTQAKPTTDYEQYMKSLMKCSAHPERNLELYCSDCSKVICALCLVKTCGKHTFSLFQDEDDKFLKEVEEKNKNVKDIIARIKNTRKELEKNYSLPNLVTVDSKSAETELTEHFSCIHAILQKRENDLMTELKNNKNYLNTMIAGLCETADNLTNFTKAVDVFTNPDNKQKLSRTNIPKLLQALREAADTPWFIENDVDNTSPSILLKINDDAMKDIIKNHCKVKVENLCLKLLATSQLPSYVELPPVPVYADSSSAQHQQSPGNQNSKSSLGNHTFQFTHTSNNSVHKIVTAAKPPLKVNKPEILPLTEGSTEKVVVTHINDPHDFYIQRMVILPKLKEMSDFYQSKKKILLQPSSEDIKIGGNFIIFDAEAKRWDRVRIINSKNLKDESKILLIDYGNTDTINNSRLRICPEETKYPIFAQNCSIIGCKPIKGKWTDEDTLLMHSLVIRSNGECLINVVRISNLMLEVDMVTCPATPSENSTSIKEALIYLEHACIGDPKNQVNRYNNPLVAKTYFQKQKLGEIEQIIVTSVISPSNFYVRKRHLTDYFNNLSKELEETYSLSNKTGAIYTPNEGMCVACYVEGKWWRARIIKLLNKNNVEVYLVDSGEKRVISWTAVRKLTAKFFKMDELVSCCKLGEIKPIGDNWTPQATNFMKSYLNNDAKCYITVIASGRRLRKRDNNRDLVLLYLNTEEGVDVCLNTELIKNDFACSIQQQQQVVQPISIMKRQVSNRDTPAEKTVGVLKLQVKILSAVSPSEIYISVSDEKELERLEVDLQKFYENSSQCNVTWKQGDKCAVFSLKDKRWHRAIIEKINDPTELINVFLKDCAIVLEVNGSCLRPLNEKFLTVPDGALKCHLSGIIPASGGKWPMLTCETLQEITKSYDRFYITKSGDISNKSLPVELWVYHMTPGEALTPATKMWKLVNQIIVEKGLAIPDRTIEKKPSRETSEFACTSKEVKDGVDELVAELGKTNIADRQENTASVCDEFIPPIIHEDWLPALPLNTTEFLAMPTYVDDNLHINLYDINQHTSTLELLSTTLTTHFKNSKPKPYDMFWYPGQICITKYDLDDRYYRARVISILEDSRALVTFVDYANTQECPISSLRKDIVLHHIPQQTYKCRLHDVKPVDGIVWEEKICDFVHQSVVEKECLVVVMGEAKDGIIPISLKINRQHDLSKLLLSLHYAIPDEVPQPETGVEKSDDFIVEEETNGWGRFPSTSKEVPL